MKPFYWALLASLIWGCVPALEKLGLAKVPAMAGLFYRCLGVLIGIVLLLFFQFGSIKESFFTGKSGLLYLMAGGFLASILGQVFFYQGLKTGEASTIVPVAASYPIVSFLIGTLFLGEPLTLAKAGGVLFVVLGVVLLK
ncbi:MAG TPA: EamA family transporter [Candidatus Omnitrophota bacterium]|nr:EamA family transporter [Candidatus Omnitrophota bacterium]HPD85613.1 EamA family transporter [Candidatus Omnitrophota bacterium]HRZ04456.1 EamA family transporter [Candidatus Omnitrophota bacterium]